MSLQIDDVVAAGLKRAKDAALCDWETVVECIVDALREYDHEFDEENFLRLSGYRKTS